MHTLFQAREVKNSLEHAFSPITLNLVVAHKGVRQPRRFLRYLLVGSNHLFKLFAKELRIHILLVLIFLKLLVQAINLLTQWREKLPQTSLTLFVHRLAAMV